MGAKRGRFDITVMNNEDENDGSHPVIYAVAGSNGHSEQPTAEKYDSRSGKWSFIASLPVSVSSIGEF